MKIRSFIVIVAGLLAVVFLLFWMLYRVAITIDLARGSSDLDFSLVLSDVLSLAAILGVVISVTRRSDWLLVFSYCLGLFAFLISFSASGAGGREEVKAFGAYGIALIVFNAALVESLIAQRLVDEGASEKRTGDSAEMIE